MNEKRNSIVELCSGSYERVLRDSIIWAKSLNSSPHHPSFTSVVCTHWFYSCYSFGKENDYLTKGCKTLQYKNVNSTSVLIRQSKDEYVSCCLGVCVKQAVLMKFLCLFWDCRIRIKIIQSNDHLMFLVDKRCNNQEQRFRITGYQITLLNHPGNYTTPALSLDNH